MDQRPCARRTTRRRRRRWSAAASIPQARRGVAGPPRHPVPRRAAGVPALRAGDAAPAARGRRGDGRAGARLDQVPRQVHAGRRDEPDRPAATHSDNPKVRDKYLAKLSGPLLDRIDMHVEVPGGPLPRADQPPAAGPTARRCASRCCRRATVQPKRFGDGTTNARMDSRQLKKYVRPVATAACC